MAVSGHGTRAVVAALLANIGIAIAKFVGFLLTSSASMLAESVHSVADSGNQVLLLFGQKRSRRAPTAEHPFGYGRERYFWAFVVALILFSLGGMFAIYEGVTKIRDPHELESPSIAIGILLAAVALESASFRTAIVESRRQREPGMSWWGFIHRSKQPELPVVLLEDFGALVGLMFALVAVSATVITDDPLWDGIGTLSIGVLLVVIAVVLAIEMKGLLIGEAASLTDQQRIAAAIEIEPSVTKLIHMRTQHIGPDELLVGAKLELVHGLSVDDAVEAVNRIENSVRRAVPTARVMYLEPDIFRTSLPSDHAAPLAAGTVLVDAPAEGLAPQEASARHEAPRDPAPARATAVESTAGDAAEPE
ncbi:MAG TPA: cation diffusion facilitator family transporter [Acidimicrobiales bacterium]|nr:cation diffusion facilitator family transporter [Acidimicrobiales bacterium]